MVILAILALVWVLALSPIVVRWLRERGAVSSVGSFSRARARLSSGTGPTESGGSVPGAVIGYSAAAQRYAEVRYGSELGSLSWGSARSVGAHSADLGPLVSRATAIRRRRVVVVLCLGTAVAFLMGLAVSMFLYLGIIGLVATIGYLGLLAYFHRIALEQAQKVVAFETRRGVAMALDHARQVSGAPDHHSAVRPRMSGSGWSVPATSGDRGQLASTGR